MTSILIAVFCALCALPAVANDAFSVTTPGKAGSAGPTPLLVGAGNAAAGSQAWLELSDAPASSATLLIVGFSELGAPFKGGVLGPTPELLFTNLQTDASGALVLPFEIPSDVPACFQLWSQFWISDPGLVPAFAASNSVRVTVQLPVAQLFDGSTSNLEVGDDPLDVAAGDLDGDGHVDLVTANAGSDDLSVLFGLGDGAFAEAVSVAAGNAPRSVLVDDVNADGALDIVVGRSEPSGAVAVLLGAGDGNFAAPVGIPIGANFGRDLALGDFNGDSLLDLAVGTSGSVSCGGTGGVALLLGDGDGGFGAPQCVSLGGRTSLTLSAADLDLDGALDVVVGYGAAFEFAGYAVLLGGGDGTLGAPAYTELAESFTRALVLDVDADGVPDVVTGSGSDSPSLLVSLGAGDGSFGNATALGILSHVGGIALGDVDRDGLPDIIAKHAPGIGHPAGMSFVARRVNGMLGTPQYIANSADSSSLVLAADVDGNAAVDLIGIVSALDDVRLMLNLSPDCDAP